jgi:hypothetical protein
MKDVLRFSTRIEMDSDDLLHFLFETKTREKERM